MENFLQQQELQKQRVFNNPLHGVAKKVDSNLEQLGDLLNMCFSSKGQERGK